MYSRVPEQLLATLRPHDALVWRALGNGELRRGVVVQNYPLQERLWAFTDLPDYPDMLLVVEYRQVIACGNSALSSV